MSSQYSTTPLTISEVYRRYQIMPNLQQHQLRVATVGQLICQQHPENCNVNDVVTALLLHDMGNIIKFDLSVFPEFLEPEGLIFWESMQASFVQRFGPDEHQASIQIAAELGMSDRVLQLIECISFSLTQANYDSDELDRMICAYSDLRVTPAGVVSLAGRIHDLEQRYSAKYPGPEHQQARQAFGQAASQIEKRLFVGTKLQPNQITDDLVNDTIDDLRSWRLSASLAP